MGVWTFSEGCAWASYNPIVCDIKASPRSRFTAFLSSDSRKRYYIFILTSLRPEIVTLTFSWVIQPDFKHMNQFLETLETLTLGTAVCSPSCRFMIITIMVSSGCTVSLTSSGQGLMRGDGIYSPECPGETRWKEGAGDLECPPLGRVLVSPPPPHHLAQHLWETFPVGSAAHSWGGNGPVRWIHMKVNFPLRLFTFLNPNESWWKIHGAGGQIRFHMNTRDKNKMYFQSSGVDHCWFNCLLFHACIFILYLCKCNYRITRVHNSQFSC